MVVGVACILIHHQHTALQKGCGGLRPINPRAGGSYLDIAGGVEALWYWSGG